MTGRVSLRAYVTAVTGGLLAAVVVLIGATLAGAPLWLILCCAFLLLPVAVAALLWLASRLSDSLRRATESALALSRGLEAPLSSTGAVEIDELGRALAASGHELRKRRHEAQESEDLYIALAESLPALV